MSAPNNNDGEPPIFIRQHRAPRQIRRTPSGLSLPRTLVRRNEGVSSPQYPTEPESQIPSLRPASIVRTPRPRLQESRNLLEAQRRLAFELDSRSNRIGSALAMRRMQLAETDRRLTEAIERSQALLSEPFPAFGSSTPPAQTSDSPNELHPPKRRRLDVTPTQEDEAPKIHQVNYGYKGQVVPGNLNMALQYCDGGVFEEGVCCPEHNIPNKDFFGVQNIFKDDKSVYCTEGSHCNIIIQHEGGRPFTMKELIIKAPRSGYTSPVKEGMVFAGMDVDELMMRTAQYKIQYDKKKQKKRRRSITSIRYFPGGRSRTIQQDSVIFARKDSAAVIPEEFIGEDEGYKVETFCSTDVESDGDDDSTDDTHSWRTQTQRSYSANRIRTQQDIFRDRLFDIQSRVGHVHRMYQRQQAEARELDEEDSEIASSDEEGLRAWAAGEDERVAERERRRLRGESVSSDDDDDDDDNVDDDEDDEESADDEDEDATMSNIADDDADANKDSNESAYMADSNNAGYGSNSGSTGTPKMLQARAQFSISRGKSTCRMVFEPAISARFVLLKLYCSNWGKGRKKGSRQGNIDIQNVTVKGWCGPRLFQSVQLM